MPKEFSRTQRVSELLQRELADIIRRELSIPSLGLITVSSVDVSPDLKQAKVYVTSLNAQQDHKHICLQLNEAAGELRHHLSQRIRNMRHTPRLLFFYDESIEYGSRLSALIESVSPEKSDPEEPKD